MHRRCRQLRSCDDVGLIARFSRLDRVWRCAHDLAQPSATTTCRCAGLSQPVEIIRDRWGINHIYAQNEPDLFFAQGYAAAKDRLFQFELWRRQATGTVAEILGPARS